MPSRGLGEMATYRRLRSRNGLGKARLALNREQEDSLIIKRFQVQTV